MSDVKKVKYNDTWLYCKDETARARNVPAGGTAGQVLKKKSGTDYDTEWGAGGSDYELPVASASTLGGVKVGPGLSISDGVLSAEAQSGVPTGGTIGQVLAKNSDTDGDVGWYDLYHLPHDKWYLVDGINESNVIAAYMFVNQADQAAAYINVNDGTIYNLTGNTGVTWDAIHGVMIPATLGYGITNDTLVSLASNVRCAAMRFSGGLIGDDSTHQGGIMLSDTRMLLIRGWRPNTVYLKTPSMNYNMSKNTIYKVAGYLTEGVYAINFNSSANSVYADGVLCSSSSTSGTADTVLVNKKVLGQMKHASISISGTSAYYVQALAFYNVELSAEQHATLARQMNALVG